MAKKQPIVAHLADKAARGKPQLMNLADLSTAIRGYRAAASKDAAKKPVSTAKASPAKPARTVVPAPVANRQEPVGGQQHLFVNLPLGALFTWDPDSGMPPMFYVKWADHFFRELNTTTPRAINPTLAAIRCYHLPEKEVVARLKGMGT